MKLGDKILKLRKKKGYSQEELADIIKVSRQTISNWELNETTPSVNELKLLSKEFDISIDELVDNDIKNVLVEKLSNTERLAGIILKILKSILIIVPILIVTTIILLFLLKIVNKNKDTGRVLTESIHCKIYGEEHSFTINYQELTGIPLELGGDAYFSDILELNKYNDAHQIFNIINDYVKKNGGSCNMISDKNLNDILDITIKEGSISNESVILLIKKNVDYNVTFGQSFYLEKYNYKTNNFEKLYPDLNNNCAFIDIAYGVNKGETFELKQNWKCMYGKLDKGQYRIVKDVFFVSDIPIDENKKYNISVEFSIE